jgi:predicted nucleic acid-binding protein
VKLFVLDASVALSWFVDDPVPIDAVRSREMILQGDRAIVPGLWLLEMANGLVMAERRGKLAADDIDKACQQLEVMLAQGIEVFTEWPGPRESIRYARVHKLTAYDAAYLELARRERLALATLDRNLRSAAQSAGVSLIV